MADSSEEVSKFVERMQELNDRLGAFDKSIALVAKRVTEHQLELEFGNKVVRETTKKAKDSYAVADKMRKEETDRYRRQYKERIITEEEYTASIAAVNKKFVDAVEYSPNFKAAAERVIGLENAFVQVETFLNQKWVRGLTGVYNAFATTIGNLTAGYNASNTGLQSALNNATNTFKTISAAATGLLKMIPGASAVLGPIVSAIGDAGLAVMEFMNRQVESIASSFKEASAAGAIFADGVSGLKNAAFNAGLTTELFGKALNENRDNVTLFGGSMTAGAKRIGEVSKFINREQLQNLGFGLEEMPGLIANVGARMRRSGAATDEQVARATAAYAQNLRIISDLTGEDAKTLQAKADQDASDLAYQQYLADKTPEQRAAIENELKALPEASQQMFKEMVKSGGNIFTEQSGILASQVPAFEKMARSLYGSAERGVVSQTEGLQILQQYGQEAKGQVQGLKDLGLAASQSGSDFGEVAKTMAQALPLLNKTPEDLQKLRDNVTRAQVTEDPVTANLAKAEQEGMANQIKIQQSVMDGLGAYLTVVNKLNDVTSLLATGMEKLSNAVLGNGEKFDDFTKTIAQSAKEGKELSHDKGWLTGSDLDKAHAKLLTMTEEQIKTLALVQGTTADKILKTGGFSGAEQFNKERADDQAREQLYQQNQAFAQPGIYADGGIASGPTSGFGAILHGREAIVPLPDGVTSEDLPEYLSRGSSSSYNEMAAQLSNSISQPMNQQSDLMQTLINKVDTLIDATRSVANHTERTAARVA